MNNSEEFFLQCHNLCQRELEAINRTIFQDGNGMKKKCQSVLTF